MKGTVNNLHKTNKAVNRAKEVTLQAKALTTAATNIASGNVLTGSVQAVSAAAKGFTAGADVVNAGKRIVQKTTRFAGSTLRRAGAKLSSKIDDASVVGKTLRRSKTAVDAVRTKVRSGVAAVRTRAAAIRANMAEKTRRSLEKASASRAMNTRTGKAIKGAGRGAKSLSDDARRYAKTYNYDKIKNIGESTGKFAAAALGLKNTTGLIYNEVSD